MIRIQSVFTGLPGLPGVSSLYFRGASQAQADAAAAAVNDLWLNLQGNMADEITVDIDNVAVNIDFETGDQDAFYSVTGGSYVGDSSSEPLPLVTQLNLNFRTAGVVNSRRVQGRIFIPGLTEADSINGSVNTLLVASFATAAANALGDLDAGNEHVVWSRPVEGGRAGSVHDVTVYSVNPEWSYLRSRRPS